MEEYLIRVAKLSDVPFLAEAIIAAEKGVSDKLSYSTLFNLTEAEVRDLIISILKEEVDGCELSLSSFFVVEYNNEPVAAAGGWIEGYDGGLPSKILKSNLLNYTFDKTSIEFLKTKSDIIKNIIVDRDPLTLQFEYFYISDKHLGKGLDDMLMQKIEDNALAVYPELEKAQCQLFKNSIFGIKILMRHGFKIVKSYKSGNSQIFDYLPSNEKVKLEKTIKK